MVMTYELTDDDVKHLRYMHEAAAAAVTFVQGRGYSHVSNDPGRVAALARAIELIGLEAQEVSGECRFGFPIIPWEHIVGVHQRILHNGEDINLSALWWVVTEILSPLLYALEQIIDTEICMTGEYRAIS